MYLYLLFQFLFSLMFYLSPPWLFVIVGPTFVCLTVYNLNIK